MGRQLLHVEQPQAMSGEDLLDHEQREIGEMLVVDRVELGILDQPRQMRELHRQDTVLRQQMREAGDEIVEIGNMGQHIVAEQKVRPGSLVPQRFCEVETEKCGQGRHPVRLGCFRDVGGRLDAEDGDAGLDEMLQQVTVVAGDFDDRARRVQTEPLRRHLRIGLGMGHPARGER